MGKGQGHHGNKHGHTTIIQNDPYRYTPPMQYGSTVTHGHSHHATAGLFGSHNRHHGSSVGHAVHDAEHDVEHALKHCCRCTII